MEWYLFVSGLLLQFLHSLWCFLGSNMLHLAVLVEEQVQPVDWSAFSPELPFQGEQCFCCDLQVACRQYQDSHEPEGMGEYHMGKKKVKTMIGHYPYWLQQFHTWGLNEPSRAHSDSLMNCSASFHSPIWTERYAKPLSASAITGCAFLWYFLYSLRAPSRCSLRVKEHIMYSQIPIQQTSCTIYLFSPWVKVQLLSIYNVTCCVPLVAVF